MKSRPTPLGNLDPALDAKSQRMIDKVRAHHQLGRRANSGENSLSTADFAVANAINSHAMRTAHRFARLYTDAEMEGFCSLRRPNGLPLHSGHVTYLLSVTNKKHRRRFEVQAAKEGWSSLQLHAAILAQREKHPQAHGRPMKPPASPSAGLLQLVAEGQLLGGSVSGGFEGSPHENPPQPSLATQSPRSCRGVAVGREKTPGCGTRARADGVRLAA